MKFILSLMLSFHVSFCFSQDPEKQILIYDHDNSAYIKEKIYGGDFLYWLYNSNLGKVISPIATQPLLSTLYGSLQNNRISKGKIKQFINDYQIKINEYEAGSLVYARNEIWNSYRNFNEFFTRKFKTGVRSFNQVKTDFPAFVEARYLILENVDDDTVFPVKGKYLSSKALLKNQKWLNEFKDSVVIIGRLNPTDYHRFHFPDQGRIVEQYRINGKLNSVNPIALDLNDEVFSENERHVTILETKNFGRIAYIEVGAMMVGKIIQTYKGVEFSKGQEKGIFKFGASTVIVLVQKNLVNFSRDIVYRSENENVETFIKLGTRIGKKL